ncbi:MAG: glycosyltransferase family 4 protein [Bryobacteraceae bacterium]
MAALRIGVNALYLIPGGVGGTEIYLRNLLKGLSEVDSRNEYLVFTNRETGADLLPRSPNFVHVQQPVRAESRPLRLLWEQTGLPAAAARARLDCLFNPGFTAPAVSPCPSVTVFHDLQHKRHPEHFRWFDLPFWRAFLYSSAKRSTVLVAVSEATKADLIRYYKVPASRVHVIPHGVEQEFFEIGRRRGKTDPYILCVSTLHPHKNLERLIRAFAEFRKRRPEFSLILAGMRGFHADAVEELVQRLKLETAVRLTGWIPREELYQLYEQAEACIYPSTFEGFGMPVLEAMAARVPVACSAIEPLKSVAGEAALLFPPEDEAAIADAMTCLTSEADLRTRLVEAGWARASAFTWQAAAQKTLEAIQTAVRSR